MPAANSSSATARYVSFSVPKPDRILAVTGIPAARTAARAISPARRGLARIAAPAPPPVTFRTGHPMLMSTKSNPRRAIPAAASAISPGSEPNSWAPMGRSASS